MKSFHITGFQITESGLDGTTRDVCIVSREDLAKDMCFKNNYRSYTPVDKFIVIFETVFEVEAAKQDAIREKALAKLTKEERTALGLS